MYNKNNTTLQHFTQTRSCLDNSTGHMTSHDGSHDEEGGVGDADPAENGDHQ